MRTSILFILLQISVIQLYGQCGDGETVLLDSQTKVDNFLDDYCTDFNGNLQIFDNNDDQDNIVSLAPLLSITKIGMLTLNYNSNLESLSGLDSVSFIGALWIANNPLLENLQGLNSLKTLIGDLTLFGNNNLEEINALSSLSTIQSTGGYITISENPVLNDLSGLNTLSSYVGGIIIVENELLNSLNGLQNLKIFISSNSLVEQVQIYDNKSLSDCSIKSLCDALSKPDITFFIDNNGIDCSSDDEILSNCNGTSISTNISSIINLYPNPVEKYAILESPVKGQLTVFNSIGKMVMLMQIQEGINRIDFSESEKGVYILNTSFGFSKRVIKL